MKRLPKFLLSNLLLVSLIVGCSSQPMLSEDKVLAVRPEPPRVVAAPAPSPAPAPAAPKPADPPAYTTGSASAGGSYLLGSTAGGSPNFITAPKKKNGVKPVTVPYRRFLLHDKGQNVLRDPELKSFIIFTHRPKDETELKLYQAICRQWVADFDDYAAAVETAKYLPSTKLTPFYWPTKDKEVTSGDCSTLYNYDYAFAAAVVGLVGKPMQSVGPLLALQQSGEWLTLDISKFEPIDVQRAFLIWKTQIVSENPLSAKFTLVKFREYFRTLVQMYGESIAKYVKIG